MVISGHNSQDSGRWALHRGSHHARRDDPPPSHAARRRRNSRDQRHARCQPVCRAIAENAGMGFIVHMNSNFHFWNIWCFT